MWYFYWWEVKLGKGKNGAYCNQLDPIHYSCSPVCSPHESSTMCRKVYVLQTKRFHFKQLQRENFEEEHFNIPKGNVDILFMHRNIHSILEAYLVWHEWQPGAESFPEITFVSSGWENPSVQKTVHLHNICRITDQQTMKWDFSHSMKQVAFPSEFLMQVLPIIKSKPWQVKAGRECLGNRDFYKG